MFLCDEDVYIYKCSVRPLSANNLNVLGGPYFVGPQALKLLVDPGELALQLSELTPNPGEPTQSVTVAGFGLRRHSRLRWGQSVSSG